MKGATLRLPHGEVTSDLVEALQSRALDDFEGHTSLGGAEAMWHKTSYGRGMFRPIPTGRYFPVQSGEDDTYCYIMIGRESVQLRGP
jgi:hypothetical protein